MLNQLLVLYSLMEYRTKTIDADLQAAAEALEANPDSKEAMLKKSQLLREKAQLMDGGPERDAVLEGAGRLEKRAGKSQLPIGSSRSHPPACGRSRCPSPR